MSQYWVGDLHFGHEFVSKLRGFNSTDEHDDYILSQLRELSANDTVYFLGDMTSGRLEHEVRMFKLMSMFKFTKVLYSGNHDSCAAIHRKSWKSRSKWSSNFDAVLDFGRMRFGNTELIINHYPYAAMGDGEGRDGSRYEQFRLPDVGNPLLHAHTHQDFPFAKIVDETVTRVEFNGYDLNSMCVSWDTRRGLTTERDIQAWLRARQAILNGDEFANKVANKLFVGLSG